MMAVIGMQTEGLLSCSFSDVGFLFLSSSFWGGGGGGGGGLGG